MLIAGVGFPVHCLDGLGRGSKGSADAMGVAVVATFDHWPVGPVTVEGQFHASAARSNTDVGPVQLVELLDDLFGLADVVECRSWCHVSTIDEDVQAHLLHAFFSSLFHQPVELVGMRVDVPVRVQAQQVQRLSPTVLDRRVPVRVLEQGT